MTDRTILAIVGSNTFVCPSGLAIALNQINAVVNVVQPDEITSGRSPYGGVDDLAEQVARNRGVPFRGFAPMVNRWEGKGYQWRNHLVAGHCTMLLRIACAHSKTWGSGYTAMIARKEGKPVQEFWVYEDGRVTDVAPRRNHTSTRAPAPRVGETREQLALDVPVPPPAGPRRSETETPAMTTPLAAAVRVTARCETCGEPFEQPAERMLAGKPYRWCKNECFQASRAIWAAENTGPACKICAGPVCVASDTYGLPICGICRNIAFNACWKKRSYTSGFQAMQWIRRYKEQRGPDLTPYRCHLCGGRWHAWSGGADEHPSETHMDQILALAALFEELGFDIDRARGYTVMPDGSHQPAPAHK